MTRYWDRVAEEKTFTHPVDVSLLTAHLPLTARILDLGCGYGRTLQTLHAAGFTRVHGVDTSANMVARGRRQFPHLSLAVVDEGPLPFGDGSQDAVCLLSVLTCIPQDEGQRSLLGEVVRVLRPGGLLFVSDLYLQEDGRNRDRYDACDDGPYGVFDHPDGIRFRHHDRTWLATLFAHLDSVSDRDIDLETMHGHPARAFQRLLRTPR